MAVIDATERLNGHDIERAYVDKGYRGHDTANPHRVFISGQKGGVLLCLILVAITRAFSSRAALKPVS